jgi:DNA-binding IclR family transcriptional regulator
VAKAETRNSIQVIERMSRLLEALARHGQPAALKSLAEASGLHTASSPRW